MAADGIRLGPNQYGKAEVRLVRVTRDTARHEVEDLTVTSQLRGAFEASHLTGDNSRVLATDTQKNTVYAFARRFGVGAPETFLLRLGRHFVDESEWVTGGRWAAQSRPWQRIGVGGRPHDHAFVRAGTETRTAVVVLDGDDTHVVSGLTDLVVLKSTGSEFSGFPRDGYTTLAETDDRVLATSVTARWRYAATDPAGLADLDWTGTFDSVRTTMLETFASLHSLALQQTLYAMGAATLRAHPAIADVRLSMPNRHHVLVDLAPFGLDNPGEVFVATDRPYGLIEAAVEREDAEDAAAVWAAVTGFC